MDSFKSMKEKNMLEREEATFLDKINSFKSMKEKKHVGKKGDNVS